MLIHITCVFFLIICLKLSASESYNSTSLWLPKCCPRGKQMSSDGKSCVEDNTGDYEFNSTDKAVFSDNFVSMTVNDTTVKYQLQHRTKFNCLRHEVYAVKDDILVTPDNSIIVFDDFGENWTLTTTELCVDSVFIPPSAGLGDDKLFVALLCPSCQRVPCLHKCCPESQHLQVDEDGTKVDCIPSSSASWSEELFKTSSKRPFVFHGFPECSNSLYLEYLDSRPEVSKHGHIRLPRMTVPRSEYCGDSSTRGPVLLACRQMLVAGALKPTIYGGMFCLGAVFLGITLILHLWLPELRKTLHSRVLIAHVACLLISYLGLAVVNLATLPAPSAVCSTAAFSIQFAILAAIFWLNAMCVDIAWTFSGLRTPKASLTLDSDGHKFLYYSLYVWGSTAGISGVTAFLEYSPVVPPTSRFKPSFGTTRCWFQDSESILLLVYGPMGVLLVANIFLFIYTAYKILQTQRDTADVVQHASGSRLRENKDRFTLYLKLFGLMGITWVFEVVSWLVGGPDSFWYITDAINALRSVFIFALFCFKKKVLVLIKAKLSKKQAPKFPMHPRKSTSSKMSSSMTSQRTNSIQLSQISTAHN